MVLVNTAGPEVLGVLIPMLLDNLEQLVKDTDTTIDDHILSAIEQYFQSLS